MKIGDIVRDRTGFRGIIIDVLAEKVQVQWTEYASWIGRRHLTVCNNTRLNGL